MPFFFPLVHFYASHSHTSLHFSPLNTFSSFFVSSPLPSNPARPNTHTPFHVTSLSSNFLLSMTLPPSSHSTFSTSSSHDPGFYQSLNIFSTVASTFPRSRRFIIPLLPLSLAPSALFIMAPHPFLHSAAASSQNLSNRKSGVTPGSGSQGDT